jgi:hypothetical protein
VGVWVIAQGFWSNTFCPVVQVDDQDRVQMMGSKKWIERKKYYKRVQCLDGLCTGDTVLKKNANAVQRQLAKNGASLPFDLQTNFYLQGVRGKIEHIFENGTVLLRNTDLLGRSWDSQAVDLEKL